jgi:hypothetical protein
MKSTDQPSTLGTAAPLPVDQSPCGLLVIEGILTELHVALEADDLLEQIDRHYQKQQSTTAQGNQVRDLCKQPAFAASNAWNGDEDTEKFICLVGEHVVCGSFGGASKLPAGTHVRCVGQQHNDVLVAEGILSDSAGHVWADNAKGYEAELISTFKLAT